MKHLIENITRYVSLSTEEIEIIEQLFSRQSVHKGTNILEEGEICKSLYFVSKGLLRHYINVDGKELNIHFNEEDTFACDYYSFINQLPSDKTIEALEDTVLYTISYNNLQQFYKSISSGERFGRLLLEEIFTLAIRHIISIHKDTIEQRYLNFIDSFYHIQQRIPQFHIASFIGVTPQSLSRIRRRYAGIKLP